MLERTARAAWRCSTFGVVATLATACSNGSGGELTPLAVDSAGIAILTYDLTGVEVPTYGRLGDLDLEIGTQAGASEYTFSAIPDVAVAPDGAILVSDAFGRELRVFDASGQFTHSIGQPGEGPGEFGAAPHVAGFDGDSVFVFDDRLRRLTAFTHEGEVGSTAVLGFDGGGRPMSAIRLEDGTLLSLSRWTPITPDRAVHDLRLELDSAVVEHLGADGQPLDTLLVLADRPRARHSIAVADGGIRTREAVPPFVPRAFVRLTRSQAIVARSDLFELQFRDFRGELEAVLRVLGAQNPMTGDELRRRQDAALVAQFGENVDPLLRRLNVEFIPDGLQAFQNILVGVNGDVWVARAEFDSSNGYEWLVFDPSGVLRGTVTTPPRVRLFEVHDDFVIGVFRDELDVSFVRRYPLDIS